MSDYTGKEIDTAISTSTVKQQMTNLRNTLVEFKELLKNTIISIDNNNDSVNNLKTAKTYYNKQINKIQNKTEKMKDKEKLNDRIAIFYERDYEFKKSIIYYLKMLYLVFIFMVVSVVIYKKKHKEKKIYGFLLLLFIIPFFLIKKAYRFFLNFIGHINIDILYVFFIFLISIISFGVYFISTKIFVKKKTIIEAVLEKKEDII
tara:strand:+ start:3807 stop:4418 length:612 start_codon:yes stop_codon:yes gene_type:complete